MVIERSRKNAQVRRHRRVATFITKGAFYAKETFFHHPPEIRGPGFAGGPIVRDRNEELSDPAAWSDDASADRLERRYYATDWQGRVVSLVTAGGVKAEDYRYSATGVPFGIPLGDVNADGKVDGGTTGADYTLAFDQEDGGVYDARVDLNLDGALTQFDDVAIVAGQDGVATGRGELSASALQTRFSTLGTEHIGAIRSAQRSIRDATSGSTICTTACGRRKGTARSMRLLRCWSIRRYIDDELPPDALPPDSYPPRFHEGYTKGLACIQSGAVTWNECMTCCTWGVGSEHDPLGWGCREACERFSFERTPEPDLDTKCRNMSPVDAGPICLTYGACDSYMFANATCFCNCMGNDDWSRLVRACLACFHRGGRNSNVAHQLCYAEADRFYPRQWLQMAYCARKCWRHQLYACTMPGLF